MTTNIPAVPSNYLIIRFSYFLIYGILLRRDPMLQIGQKVVSRKFIRVRKRNQITLPNEIVAGSISAGDFLEVVLAEDGSIHLTPTQLIAFANSPQAHRQEMLAEKDIANKAYKTFDNADDLMKDIASRRAARRKVATEEIATVTTAVEAAVSPATAESK
jgi:hypothetical protein